MGPHYIDYIDHTEWHTKLVEPWCHMCRLRLSCITPFTLEYLLCRITSCDLTPKHSPPRTHTMLLVINTDTLDVRWYHFNFLYQWYIHCCHEIFIVVIQKYEFSWLVRGFAGTRTPFYRLFCARPWGPFFSKWNRHTCQLYSDHQEPAAAWSCRNLLSNNIIEGTVCVCTKSPTRDMYSR